LVAVMFDSTSPGCMPVVVAVDEVAADEVVAAEDVAAFDEVLAADEDVDDVPDGDEVEPPQAASMAETRHATTRTGSGAIGRAGRIYVGIGRGRKSNARVRQLGGC